MPLVEPIIRPPSEAESFLLQVTTGCSANSCTFCGAYRGKPFRVMPREVIEQDIDEWADLSPETRRVFLLDGDALAAGNDLILPVLEKIGRSFPGLGRVSSYANGFNISARSGEELGELAERKLKLVYLGLESGARKVLERCRKRSTAEEMVTAVERCREAGIKSSVIVLLGLGGRDLREEHVNETAAALNRMQPKYLSFLTLTVLPGTALSRQVREGSFALPGPMDMLREARDIIARLELKGTIFRANHASNYLTLGGRFPQDKESLITVLDSAARGETALRSEGSRGL
jgi:radical SAM superfamily enzyme YgiQ (UPF0313 family)